MTECHFWADVMLRQRPVRASKASFSQKWLGFRVVVFQKLFKGYNFWFRGDSFGRYIFELFARETNVRKKRSVSWW